MPYDPKNVFHYGMTVPEMDEAVAAWTAMGAEVLMPPVEAEGVGVMCCVLQFNGSVLELVAAITDEARERMQQMMLRPGAIDHVAYFSDDLAADIEALEKRGGQVAVPITFNTGFDRNMAFLQMPTGMVIELMERQATGKKPEDPLARYNKVVANAG